MAKNLCTCGHAEENHTVVADSPRSPAICDIFPCMCMEYKPAKSKVGETLRQSDAPKWMQKQENAITPEVAKELEALGHTIPDWVKIIPPDAEIMKTALYICRAIEEGHPESLADNAVGKCSMCSRRIEYRPHAPKEITKICGECAQAKAESPNN